MNSARTSRGNSSHEASCCIFVRMDSPSLSVRMESVTETLDAEIFLSEQSTRRPSLRASSLALPSRDSSKALARSSFAISKTSESLRTASSIKPFTNSSSLNGDPNNRRKRERTHSQIPLGDSTAFLEEFEVISAIPNEQLASALAFEILLPTACSGPPAPRLCSGASFPVEQLRSDYPNCATL